MPTSIPALRASLFSARSGVLQYAAVFIAYYATALLGVYLLRTFHTSPAIIWIPTSIGVYAILRYGYRMWIPIFIGQSAAILTSSGLPLTAFASALGYAIQSVVIGYALKRIDFDPRLERMRDALALVLAAILLTTIAPGISTIAQMVAHALPVSPLFNWSRLWASGIFSLLAVLPTLLLWIPYPRENATRSERVEIASAFLLLTMINVMLFGTPFAKLFGISVIFFVPAVLIWFALRFHPRWLALGILVTAAEGIAGSIVQIGLSPMLNDQLFADEIYIGMVAAIFYVFVAVVEERRKAHADLESAFRTTLASDQAKNEFIAILAHELRNPLAPIVSSLELLALEEQSAESKDIIEDISEHTSMIRRLLDDLLDTARLAQRKFTLRKERIRFGDVIDASIASVAGLAQSKDLKLRVRSNCADAVVEADPVRLKQIVINILNNACKYTPDGGSIDLTCTVHGEEIRIRVRDSGIGISAEAIKRIFEPFKQLNGEQYGGGLGIGLYLTKQLVEMHGGSVEVESAGVDRGSTFTVSLPYEPGVDSGAAARSSARMHQGSSRILIVDDNEAAARGLQKLLAHHGHEVEVVHRGGDVASALKRFSADVILLDIGLPDMSGYEVARSLRAAGSTARIIALTGYGQESDREEAIISGCDAHLTKPVGVGDVLAVIGEKRSPSRRAAA